MKTSIIMPMHNRWELTHSRLAEMRTHLPQDSEIILVDDASTSQDVRSGTAFWQKSGIALHPIRYVHNETNIGFTKSMNRGFSYAEGDIVIFYSNDVIMTGNVVNEVAGILNSSDKPALVGNRLVHWDSGWNTFEINGQKKTVPYLEGYFIACKTVDWKALGGWDEQYSPYDFEDVDLSLQAFLSGYNLIEMNSRFIRHLSGQTIMHINSQRELITKTNQAKFLEKWQAKLAELG